MWTNEGSYLISSDGSFERENIEILRIESCTRPNHAIGVEYNESPVDRPVEITFSFWNSMAFRVYRYGSLSTRQRYVSRNCALLVSVFAKTNCYWIFRLIPGRLSTGYLADDSCNFVDSRYHNQRPIYHAISPYTGLCCYAEQPNIITLNYFHIRDS